MTATDYISIGSLIIATSAFLYSYLTNTKKYELKSQYQTEILNWYLETIEVLIRLKIATKNDSLNKELKNELLSRLSAEIEVGRFYFPNVDKKDNFGREKPQAYRGYRNLLLDFLVFSYCIFEKDDAKRYWRHAETLQRYFTSHLFEIIDPASFLKETEKHTDKTFTKELCFEDFIEKDPEALRLYL
jgi:hypothetical protein